MSNPTVPQLPQLEGDLLLDIFTHSSLDYHGKPVNETYGDNRRLADLGEKVLYLTVTQRLFDKRPMYTSTEIVEERENFTSDATIVNWVTAYQLKKNLKFAPDARDSINTPEESRFLLYSYIGAAYCQHGLVAIQNWINCLVIPDQPNPSSPGACGSSPPQPSHAPPALPGQAAQNAGGVGMTPLALFNQTAQQHGFGVGWPAESTGPAHALRWSVKCVVNNVERGQGNGRNQKLARDAAAKAAAKALGWDILK